MNLKKTIFALLTCLAGVANTGIALNPYVHQDTIAQTICVAGYTKTVRPSTTYTNGVKKKPDLATESQCIDQPKWNP